MNDLLVEYKQSLAKVKKVIRQLEQNVSPTHSQNEDLKQLRAMQRDLMWTIDWLKTGVEPSNYSFITRMAYVKREKLIGQMDQYLSFERGDESRDTELTQSDQERLNFALGLLSVREREAYILHYGWQFSYQKTADLMQVKRGTVQEWIERSNRKLLRYKEAGLLIAK
jgi:RNA polymerase sigma-70 factor (ECF subfamily)